MILRQPTALPRTPAPTVHAPSRMAGVVRSGVTVSVAQLQDRFPDLTPEAALPVQQLLQATCPDTLNWQWASNWGIAAQQRYSTLLEPTRTMHSQQHAAQQHLARLHSLLQTWADALASPRPTGLLARWQTHPDALVQRHGPEITQLHHALSHAITGLSEQVQALTQLRSDLTALADSLQSYSLAATWLAEHGNPTATDDGVTHTLLHRAAELSQMQGHVIQTGILQAHQRDNLRALVACIQHAVLLLLPAWLEQESQARLAPATPTLARQRLTQLETLLHALHPT